MRAFFDEGSIQSRRRLDPISARLESSLQLADESRHIEVQPVFRDSGGFDPGADGCQTFDAAELVNGGPGWIRERYYPDRHKITVYEPVRSVYVPSKRQSSVIGAHEHRRRCFEVRTRSLAASLIQLEVLTADVRMTMARPKASRPEVESFSGGTQSFAIDA